MNQLLPGKGDTLRAASPFFTILARAAMGVAGALVASSSVASSNVWYDKYVAAEASVGDNYYTSTDSATLAWGEAYLLRSYLDLYKLTGSTVWLDKFTLHVDTVIANANDDDNDGYLGWSTANYSTEQVTNGGFETAASGDATLPSGWSRWQATSATAFRQTTNKQSGSWGLEVVTDPTKWQKLVTTLPAYNPRSPYILTFWGRTNGSAAGGRADILDTTTGTVVAGISFTETTWTKKTLKFQAPAAAGHTLQLRLGHSAYAHTNGRAYFDGVSILENISWMVHDGQLGVPIAEFVRLVTDTPVLQAGYQTKATSYRTFLENEIVPRWESSPVLTNCWVSLSSTTGVYKFPYSSNHLPYNQYAVYLHMLMILHDVNGNATYLDRARRGAQYFKNNLTLSGTSYSWKYADYSATIEDTSHANLELSLAHEMFGLGQIFNGTDMERFTSTFMNVMWNQSTTAPLVYQRVNGTGDWSYTRVLGNWMELAQFSMTLPVVGEEQYRNFTPSTGYQLLALSRIMKWDRSKIVNQGFELKTTTDATQPAQWNRVNATSATVYLDGANAYAGFYGLTVKANGTTAQLAQQTWTKWLPSTSYTLTFMGKTDGTAAGGKVYVKNDTTGVVLATVSFTDTAWTAKSVTFTSPASVSDVVRTYIGNDNIAVANGKSHVDNIKLRVTTDAW